MPIMFTNNVHCWAPNTCPQSLWTNMWVGVFGWALGVVGAGS